MKIFKFGGTSLGSLDMINASAHIICNERKKNQEEIIVVVSAMSGVTNTLVYLCELAQKGELKKVLEEVNTLRIKHEDIAKSIGCSTEVCMIHLDIIKNHLDILTDIFKGICLLQSFTNKEKAKILYFGEILSSILLSLAINKLGYTSHFYRSADIIIGKGCYINSDFDKNNSKEKAALFLSRTDLTNEIPVITGFGCGDEQGNIYLFDRGGSDYVATILGNLFDADSVEIRTDVDGIMSADPRVVRNPIIWEELDYSVSADFALSGAKVLHPKTISPAQEKKIPVFIKNTFAPDKKGTKICKKPDFGIKGINIDNEQILLNFIDPSMLGGCGYIYEVVKIFAEEKVSIDALATTETSFSVSLKNKHYSKELYDRLMQLNKIMHLDVYENITKISIVGDSINMNQILSYFPNDIIMCSLGAYGKSLSIFVKTDSPQALLAELHEKIFSS